MATLSVGERTHVVWIQGDVAPGYECVSRRSSGNFWCPDEANVDLIVIEPRGGPDRQDQRREDWHE